MWNNVMAARNLYVSFRFDDYKINDTLEIHIWNVVVCRGAIFVWNMSYMLEIKRWQVKQVSMMHSPPRGLTSGVRGRHTCTQGHWQTDTHTRSCVYQYMGCVNRQITVHQVQSFGTYMGVIHPGENGSASSHISSVDKIQTATCKTSQILSTHNLQCFTTVWTHLCKKTAKEVEWTVSWRNPSLHPNHLLGCFVGFK